MFGAGLGGDWGREIVSAVTEPSKAGGWDAGCGLFGLFMENAPESFIVSGNLLARGGGAVSSGPARSRPSEHQKEETCLVQTPLVF